jgi:sodium transport system permease protein
MSSLRMKNILTVFKKETVDTLRDRRTVMGAMSFTILMPVMIVFMMNFIIERALSEDTANIAVVGAQGASGLTDYLISQDMNVTIVEPGTHTFRDELIADVDAVLMVDENYVDYITEGKIATLVIYVDNSKRLSRAAGNKLEDVLEGYVRHQSQMRLLAMGIPPTAVRTIVVEMADLSTAGARAKGMAFNLLYIFILTPFVASMSVAIDMTAGERERRSLQSLLSQPIKPMEIILGKWILATLFGLVGITLVVLATINGLTTVPLESIGLKLNLDLMTQLKMMVVFFPLCLLVAAAQMLVSLAAKNYKEATMYQQFLTMAPIIIGALTFAVNDSSITGLAAHLPILSHLQLSQNVLIESQFDGVGVMISAGICVALAAVCLYLTAGRLKSEKILSAA